MDISPDYSDDSPTHFKESMKTPTKGTRQKIKRKPRPEEHVEKSFVCTQCGKQFAQANYLKVHAMTHLSNNDKPHKCGMCNKGYSFPSDLTRHMYTHTNQRPFKCDICGKGFNRASHLNIHMPTHSAVKGYKCKICAREFTLQHQLTRHQSVHTRATPHKCNICRKSFTQPHGLTLHMRRHLKTMKPMYSCGICGKIFKFENEMEEHEQTCDTETDYTVEELDQDIEADSPEPAFVIDGNSSINEVVVNTINMENVETKNDNDHADVRYFMLENDSRVFRVPDLDESDDKDDEAMSDRILVSNELKIEPSEVEIKELHIIHIVEPEPIKREVSNVHMSETLTPASNVKDKAHAPAKFLIVQHSTSANKNDSTSSSHEQIQLEGNPEKVVKGTNDGCIGNRQQISQQGTREIIQSTVKDNKDERLKQELLETTNNANVSGCASLLYDTSQQESPEIASVKIEDGDKDDNTDDEFNIDEDQDFDIIEVDVNFVD